MILTFLATCAGKNAVGMNDFFLLLLLIFTSTSSPSDPIQSAGHDSPFNVTFPVLTEQVMAPAFEPLGINLITRNAAMGNNPCMPYDVCVKVSVCVRVRVPLTHTQQLTLWVWK